MPTYQYTCARCGHEFEKSQGISEKPLRVCPKDLCPRERWGKGRVKRMITAGGGLIFKGSGFYTTDYRSEQYKAAAKKESAPATTAQGDSKPVPAKSDSKPAKAEKAA